MNRFVLLLLLLMSGLSVLSGCDEYWGVREGEASPCLTGSDLNGNSVDPARYRGKITILYFWHGSCCEGELKRLDGFYTDLKDKGLVVIASNAMDSREGIAAMAQRDRLKLPLLYDERSKDRKAFGVLGSPTFVIIDRNGIMRKKIIGSVEPEQLKKLIAPYMM